MPFNVLRHRDKLAWMGGRGDGCNIAERAYRTMQKEEAGKQEGTVMGSGQWSLDLGAR